MIAADTSSFIAYLDGEAGSDTEIIDAALLQHQIIFPPAVLSELLSDPQLATTTKSYLQEIPLLLLTEGYWERVGALRAQLIRRGRKARLADALIAQSCLDHDVPLITRDHDFHAFTTISKLHLVGL